MGTNKEINSEESADVFMESVQNGLPAWRGDVYNYSEFYGKPGRGAEYDEDTIPVDQMKHIIEHHAFRKRMEVVYDKYENEIAERLHWNIKKVKEIYIRMCETMMMINDPKLNGKNMKMKSLNLNDQDLKFIQMVQAINKDEYGLKDYFPVNMSDYNIMLSIKEAYIDSEKTGIQLKWMQLFEGEDRNGLRVQFYFDVKKQIIQTAYPVFDKGRRHLYKTYRMD